jgi:hypothetical protein
LTFLLSFTGQVSRLRREVLDNFKRLKYTRAMEKTTEAQPYTAVSLGQAGGVSFSYIASLCRAGKLACQKVGPVWLIPYEVGAAWLEERKAKQDARKP